MTFLADTQIGIWSTQAPENLGDATRTLLADPTNVLLFSEASVWEASIKHSIGKLRLNHGIEGFVENLLSFGFAFLPIKLPHIVRQNTLPFHHKDPFDRMLVAQALVEDLPVLSVDRRLRDYGVRLLI